MSLLLQLPEPDFVREQVSAFPPWWSLCHRPGAAERQSLHAAAVLILRPRPPGISSAHTFALLKKSPVSVPKGGGHLLGASSRKSVAQSEKSSVTGEEKQHQQNASPHIIGGTHGTFLLRKEHQVTSGPKQKKTPDQPFQSREILPELSPSSRTNETKRIQNML